MLNVFHCNVYLFLICTYQSCSIGLSSGELLFVQCGPPVITLNKMQLSITFGTCCRPRHHTTTALLRRFPDKYRVMLCSSFTPKQNTAVMWLYTQNLDLSVNKILLQLLLLQLTCSSGRILWR